ncbi:hypothetical protein LguiA_005370 [Lonicera macranthoides]
MKLNHHNHGGLTIAGLFVLLFPLLFPCLFKPLGHASPSTFSEWNAPKPKHLRLLKSALQRETQSDLWMPLANQGWKPCVESTTASALGEESQGYIQVFLDGGLNQQRMGICDAVAVAKILNATLVIPHLEVNPVWKDSSSFMDIFDVDHFINALKDDISIVKELPNEFSWSTREYYGSAIRATRIKTAPVHASANWYRENVLPILQSYGIAAIAPFSHRLAFDNMPKDIQRLRCKVNFQALVFVPHIKSLGDALVNRLQYPRGSEIVDNKYLREATDAKAKQGVGKFVILHLRFDKDMAAHSACDFGGGKAEKLALAKYRQVYGGEARISTLRKLFPLMEDKKSLASAVERAHIKGKASMLAAVDYYVSLHSDIFISASPGNMHNAMVGHRTYQNLKTIRPNMALLGQLFLNKSMSWSDFHQQVLDGHKNRQGQLRLRKPQQSIYTYPAPDCMCDS